MHRGSIEHERERVMSMTHEQPPEPPTPASHPCGITRNGVCYTYPIPGGILLRAETGYILCYYPVSPLADPRTGTDPDYADRTFGSEQIIGWKLVYREGLGDEDEEKMTGCPDDLEEGWRPVFFGMSTPVYLARIARLKSAYGPLFAGGAFTSPEAGEV
jgi:hypothetical protein